MLRSLFLPQFGLNWSLFVHASKPISTVSLPESSPFSTCFEALSTVILPESAPFSTCFEVRFYSNLGSIEALGYSDPPTPPTHASTMFRASMTFLQTDGATSTFEISPGRSLLEINTTARWLEDGRSYGYVW
jgi:hypothetical protein